MYVTDNTTFLNGIGIAFGLSMGLLMLVLPRRLALLPVIAMVCYMTMGQRVMIVGLNFTLIRILMLFALTRIVLRGEVRHIAFGPVDRVLMWWVMSSIVTYTLLWQTSDAFVNRLGLAYDALGLYFIFRVLVRDLDDMRAVVRQFAWMVIPLAASMLVEKSTGTNPFAVLGGVAPDTMLRQGVLRCQGPFSHPILAGAFGSALLPLFFGLWAQGRDRLAAAFGMVSSLVITVTAGSSGPLMAAGCGLLGVWLWPLRTRMRAVRWTVGLTALSMHLLMEAPIWFLLARVGIFGGSTGYHRAILIDRAVQNFPSWWLIGTYSTADWGYYMFDVTNQYVLIGVQGGVLTLVLFVAIISRCFGAVGQAVSKWGDDHRGAQKLAWAFGASLLVHSVNYVSVPYFDQNIVNWYLLLAMIATAAQLPKSALQPTDNTARTSSGNDLSCAKPPKAYGFGSPHGAT